MTSLVSVRLHQVLNVGAQIESPGVFLNYHYRTLAE
jgi:hypothetical protein